MMQIRLFIVACVVTLAPAVVAAAPLCTAVTQGKEEFRGISGSSDSNVIAVGKKGSISRYDGSTWNDMAAGTNKDLNDVEVADAITAFAVGKDGTVLQLVGGVWIDHSGFTDEDLFGVWAASATEAYVVGSDGTIFRFNGVTWSDESAAAGTDNRDLTDAWGDANGFYAMSERGELYRYDRTTGSWDPRDVTCNVDDKFEDLWGDASGNLYLARKDEVYRYDGANCAVAAPAGEDLFGIHGSSITGEIYAGGKKGTVLYFDGASWQETQEAQRDILDDWVSDDGIAYFGGKKGEITTCMIPTPQVVADWHLDECTLGIAGSTVSDSGPNGLDGTVVGGLALENSGQLCAAAKFDGSSSHVSVPDAAPLDLTDGISMAAWVRHDATPLTNWEAIIAKGDSAYRLHLNGGCGIADALPGNVPFGFTFGLNGGCAGADLNSNVVPAPGAWYHVAATYGGAVMRIYINGILVNSAVYPGTINSNGFNLFLGENSQRPNRRWDGDIDEVTIWDGVLRPSLVSGHMNRTRACTNCSNVDLVINHDNYGIHCAAETIQVSVVDSLTGAPRTDYTEQITLDTQSGFGSWTRVAGSGSFVDAVADDGLATYDWPLGESTATFALDYQQGAPLIDTDVYQTSDPLIRDDDSEGTLQFSASGFTVTEAALPNPPPAVIPPFSSPRTAGTDFGVHISAYGQTPTDPTCGVIESYTGPQNLKFWFTRTDPVSGVVAVTVDGTATADNEAGALDQPVLFSNGQAVVSTKYKDAGRIRIRMKDDSLLHPDLPSGIRGSTSSFPVKPLRFVLSNIQNASGDPNPAAADASGPIFTAAGAPFEVTVTALDAEGDVTPNFGQEGAAETVRLTTALVDPAAGSDPGLLPALGFGPFIAGRATGNAFTWPEVGIVTLTPSIGDGDYLGGGDVIGTTSGNVGRFIPDHFQTAVNAPSFMTQCASGGFTYIGQDFAYATAPLLTFDAAAAGGSVTRNYTGSYFKLTNASLQNRSYSAASGLLDTSGLPPAAADPAISDVGGGRGTLLFSAGSGLSFQKSAPQAPFDADISLAIDLVDGDGVTPLANPVGFASIAFDNGANMRDGRVRFINAVGSELINLALPMKAEYFVNSTTGFVDHGADSCSDAISLILGSFTANLGAGETCVVDSGSPGDSSAGCAAAGPAGQRYREPPLGGNFNLFLQAPGAGNDGSVTVTGDVPVWLEFDWNVALPGLEDPEGVATFGIYDGDGRRIYRRESYQ